MSNQYDLSKLFTARAALLTGEPVMPDAALEELLKVLGTVMPPPPAHLWPRQQPLVTPDPVGSYAAEIELSNKPVLLLGGKPKEVTYMVPMGERFPMVGVFFTRAEFVDYVLSVSLGLYDWNPIGVCMHHCAEPDLGMRPNGFEVNSKVNHMKNLRSYYMNTRKFSAGPHIFTDDHGIWVFNPLQRRGTHAIAFNSKFYGIEALGNFSKGSKDDPYSGRGALSWDNAMFAGAALLVKHGKAADNKTLKFHREDPQTDKDCPGAKVDKDKTIKTVNEHVSAILFSLK